MYFAALYGRKFCVSRICPVCNDIQMPVSMYSRRGDIVVRAKGELHHLGVLFDKASLLQFSKLPRMSQPGSNAGIGFRSQLGVA